MSVLFCDLVGFTSRSERLDPEDVRALQAPYWARLRREIEQFQGTVEKYIGDAVMALFGAPVAHEDDPERAVRAAFAIRDAVAAMNRENPALDLHVRVAVATGEALVALAARPGDGEGMASGDVVNTCARLQAHAPVDGVLVDEPTRRATERWIVFGDAPAVEAKGKSEPIRVFEALEARGRVDLDAGEAGRVAIVGRARELDLLAGALARVREDRSSQLVTLVGVPGIGKTRLVHELGRLVEEDPEFIVWRLGRSLAYGEGVTYWALGEIVKAQAGILETDPAAVSEGKLRAAVTTLVPDPDEAAWVEAHLRPLVGLASEEAREDRRSESFAAWRRFLEALAEEGPCVLIFEDLHWADDALLDFVDHLVDWATGVPILVVATARPELLSRRAAWGGGKPNASTVSLAPLSDEDTARLLQALLGGRLLPAERQAAVLASAEGNPLYAEEFTRLLVEEGSPGELPGSVQGVIAARLDQLAVKEKELLEDASVIGKAFWLGAVAAMSDGSPFALEEHLHGLERREFVRRQRHSSVAGEIEYVFRHALVRDVAYGQIPRGRRADRHRLAAAWIDALSPDRADDRSEMLAHHYVQAIEYARAAGQDSEELADPARRALREAGERALTLGAFASAARSFQAADELAEPGAPQRATLQFGLGKALFWNEGGGFDQLGDAARLLEEGGDRERAAESRIMLSRILWHRGDQRASDEQVRAALELVADTPSSASKAFVLTDAAHHFSVREQIEQSLVLARQALAVAAAIGSDEIRSRALQVIGFGRILTGDSGGIEELEAAITASAHARNPFYGVSAKNVLGEAYLLLGDVPQAGGLKDAAYQEALRSGSSSDVRWQRMELAWIHFWLGDWDTALAEADGLLADLDGDRQSYETAMALPVRATIRLARGDTQRAGDDARRGLELARLMEDPQALAPALTAAVHTALATGERTEAERLTDELLQLFTKVGARGDPFVAPLARLALDLDRQATFLAIAADSTLRTPWIDAAIAICEARPDQAATLYRTIGAPNEEAHARLAHARALIAAGRTAEADTELAASIAFFRSVNATAYIRDAEQLLPASA